jgi:hypothetical protein
MHAVACGKMRGRRHLVIETSVFEGDMKSGLSRRFAVLNRSPGCETPLWAMFAMATSTWDVPGLLICYDRISRPTPETKTFRISHPVNSRPVSNVREPKSGASRVHHPAPCS